MRTNPIVYALSSGLIIAGLLTACTSGTPVESSAPLPSPSKVYVFYPNGTATQNLGIFQSILEKNGAGTTRFDLDTSIAELVETGFPLDSITHTSLKTKTQEIAESVSVAILFKEECIIGQFSNHWIVAEVVKPTLSGCLIGEFEQAVIEQEPAS
jgi:hypothetical protein